MEDYDSQSNVEDVSEWAEHIEDVIEELQRNYRIIQTEMSCLVEKLQLVNRPRSYISKRVVIPRRNNGIRVGNENSKNSRNCCSNCRGNTACKNAKGELLESVAENILGIANEQYISSMVQKAVSSLEKGLVERLDKSCAHHHLELQRSITDLKVQQSIMESTVRDIAVQIQDIATEVRSLKTSMGSRLLGGGEDLDSNSLASSCSCTEKSSSSEDCSSCGHSRDGKVEASKMSVYEVLRDVFVEDEGLVGLGRSSLEGAELESLRLIRQLFKDFVRMIGQGRIEALEKSIGEVRSKSDKLERNTECRLDDIGLLIKDELLNRSAEKDMMTKLEQRIQGVNSEVGSIQESLMGLKDGHALNREEVQRLEKELNSRSELIQSAIGELNSECLALRKKQEESCSLFGDEVSKNITEKISSIKDLVSYISQDIFKNEEKLQRQIKRNSQNIEELKSGCIEFEKYSDENFMEIVTSLKNFRMQTITILSSIYEVMNENLLDGSNVSDFQQKLEERFHEPGGELQRATEILQPHIFSAQGGVSPANFQGAGAARQSDTAGGTNSKPVNQRIPPNAYHINS